MINISIWKILGWFSTLLIILLFFGAATVGLYKSIMLKDYKGALINTGGKIFALDVILIQETDYLLEAVNTQKPIYDIIFHLSYSLLILFIFFFMFIILFRVGNWLLGLRAFSATTDIFLLVLILLMFFTVEFLYIAFVLDKTIYPLQGVWYFIKNLPLILQSIFTI